MPILRNLAALLLAAASGSLGVVASASAADEPTSHRCAAVDGRDARLDCFDKAFPLAPKPAEDFGLSAQQRAEKQVVAVPVPEQISATIAEMSVKKNSGRGLLVLENGQQWDLDPSWSLDRLHKGDAVSIRRTAMGAYLVSTADGLSFKARRID